MHAHSVYSVVIPEKNTEMQIPNVLHLVLNTRKKLLK